MKDSTLNKLAKPLLVLATLIWGTSFVIMKNTLDDVPVLFLLAFRFLLAAAILAAVFYKSWKNLNKSYFLYGGIMGLLLLTAYITQTYGLIGTTPGKNAFLTASYCIIVPFFNWIISRKRPDRFNVVAAVLCLCGIGLVSLTSDLSITTGDGLTLLCGFFYAAHIIAVNNFAKGRDIFLITVLQFAVAGVVSLLLSLITGSMPAAMPRGATAELLYLAIACTAGALLFQNIGQKYTEPASASVLLSLEAPFGVFFSILFYSERPSARMIFGFFLIFVAVICSETKFEFLTKKAHDEVD